MLSPSLWMSLYPVYKHPNKSNWIRLNEAVLVDYWEERIYTDELLQHLQRLP